ncbi:MAG TPA: PH domain-containing protein [Myxococcales bacterium]|nr:PH domain-containing protein [Myxococcales bacterium]
MDSAIRALTVVLLALPAIFLAAASYGRLPLLLPALFLVVLYLWIWLWFRPTGFVVKPHVLEIRWPLRRCQLRRDGITAVRLMDRGELRNEVGRSIRVGAGGLWGGFGWLRSERRGIVRMYVSRVDGLVWIERGSERPWLLTPERPEEFARALEG